MTVDYQCNYCEYNKGLVYCDYYEIANPVEYLSSESINCPFYKSVIESVDTSDEPEL